MQQRLGAATLTETPAGPEPAWNADRVLGASLLRVLTWLKAPSRTSALPRTLDALHNTLQCLVRVTAAPACAWALQKAADLASKTATQHRDAWSKRRRGKWHRFQALLRLSAESMSGHEASSPAVVFGAGAVPIVRVKPNSPSWPAVRAAATLRLESWLQRVAVTSMKGLPRSERAALVTVAQLVQCRISPQLPTVVDSLQTLGALSIQPTSVTVDGDVVTRLCNSFAAFAPQCTASATLSDINPWHPVDGSRRATATVLKPGIQRARARIMLARARSGRPTRAATVFPGVQPFGRARGTKSAYQRRMATLCAGPASRGRWTSQSSSFPMLRPVFVPYYTVHLDAHRTIQDAVDRSRVAKRLVQSTRARNLPRQKTHSMKQTRRTFRASKKHTVAAARANRKSHTAMRRAGRQHKYSMRRL